ncbi:glycosyl hydrolase [Arsenicibacter rosenii]|uniref:glycosyl hydrolase n=1 Tax=Arsenicibacter rosenii TaxID=1750698 RepID=UPI0009F4859B|nr:glycosyl hydrolase [Arsenicibacter rosenii]
MHISTKLVKRAIYLSLVPAFALSTLTQAQPKWPAITQETKPWTRWWWMGSAVNPTDLTRLMEQYQKAGLGGVEITPIYGVKGAENQFINFLSPKWMDVLGHTLKEARRLNMGVDMAQASGWPFGGPWVDQADACKYVASKTFTLKAGDQLTEPVSYIQKPITRIVGQPIDIKQLVEPIIKNPDLQLHAFDQVRFEKPLPLQCLMAYADNGQIIDLTAKVDGSGKLNWTAPAGTWTLYAVFEGWHGKMVERAGPGGEGDVIDHFSKPATEHYLSHFDKAFKGRDLTGLRAFFNDSYEVDDASGESNWTPAMFGEFKKRRGYDLRLHLPALFGKPDTEPNKRVLSDYRETISELLLENYTKVWSDWAKKHGKIIRNQAHGSPANILDLYAITDIPEIEGIDVMRIKFASSAAHVTGKKLTSSESATWENEHFLTKLSDVKKAMDRFLLGGVNHTFYHGTNYSPQNAPWPGWLFYAAVHFNPNNSFWTDFGKLNQYVARCQSFLQQGKAGNDVLVYLPIYDAYTRQGKVLLQHFDGIDHGFKGLPVEHHAKDLWERGYGFDFISDKQLLGVTTTGGRLQTGGTSYRTIVVPEAQYMPLPTLEQLIKLAQQGATIVFAAKLPDEVPGLADLAARQAAFKKLLAGLTFTETNGIREAKAGQGRVFVGTNLDATLNAAGVPRETMVDSGLEFIRRDHAEGQYYFITNWSDKAIDGWVPLATKANSVAMYNPMTEQMGMARKQASATGMDVYVQLPPGESCILETSAKMIKATGYPYTEPVAGAVPLTGKWTISFVSGGPALPAPVTTEKLGSWTELDGEDVKRFSGTATYTLTFAKPAGAADAWVLDLGRVAESARVQLNGKNLGTVLGPVYQLEIPAGALAATNKLVVTVSNGMANRIADMDKHKVEWKTFYNVNMSPRLRENRGADGNFTAENWSPRPSGLLGPVTLRPVKRTF